MNVFPSHTELRDPLLAFLQDEVGPCRYPEPPTTAVELSEESPTLACNDLISHGKCGADERTRTVDLLMSSEGNGCFSRLRRFPSDHVPEADPVIGVYCQHARVAFGVSLALQVVPGEFVPPGSRIRRVVGLDDLESGRAE